MRWSSRPAELLARALAVRGADGMRALPFLASDGGERLARLVAPLALSAGASDPESPADKGRLVWWHENLVSALDATGFCAFSAAALLADGVGTLDDLARWVLPESARELAGPGERLLGIGEELVQLQLEIEARWGAPPRELAPSARTRLETNGLAPEYRALRGLDASGTFDAEARARFERGERVVNLDRDRLARKARLPLGNVLLRASEVGAEDLCRFYLRLEGRYRPVPGDVDFAFAGIGLHQRPVLARLIVLRLRRRTLALFFVRLGLDLLGGQGG